MLTYDAIVLGAGGVGSAALYHLARRGARALAIDRFALGHDRGSSHGRTRIIRQAYFEHPDYVPMVQRAYQLWRDLEAASGQQLLCEVGLLEIGPPEGEVIRGVLASAEAYRLPVERLSADDVRRRWPGFRLGDELSAVYEPQAGYLFAERAVLAHAEQAQRLKAEVRTGETVVGWHPDGQGVVVVTDRGRYRADKLIVTAGSWASQLLGDLAIPLTVLRKAVYWLRPQNKNYRSPDCPTFLYEIAAGCFYGFPQIDDRGVKVAEHSGGRVVSDPLVVDRDIDPADRLKVSEFVAEYLCDVSDELLDHSVCLYTMTPDGHFVVDRHPLHRQVVFAAGLSGHGFKFTPQLGEALAELALDGRTRLPIEFLSCRRPALARPQSAADGPPR